MEVCICPDFFKGNLPAEQCCFVKTKRIKKGLPESECLQFSMTNGGKAPWSKVFGINSNRLHF